MSSVANVWYCAGVHLVMNDLLPAGSYYRFNPPLMQECAMDEIDTAKLDNLVVDTQAYIRYVPCYYYRVYSQAYIHCVCPTHS